MFGELLCPHPAALGASHCWEWRPVWGGGGGGEVGARHWSVEQVCVTHPHCCVVMYWCINQTRYLVHTVGWRGAIVGVTSLSVHFLEVPVR